MTTLTMLKNFIKYYLPTIFWALAIFYFSSIPGLRYSKSAAEEIFLRKGAHFLEFSVLFFLLWRIFSKVHKLETHRAYWLALLVAIFFGASDEFHQTLVSGRTGKMIDVIFDSFSIIFSAEIILMLSLRKIKLKNILVLFLSALVLVGLEVKMLTDGKVEGRKSIGLILKIEASKVKEDLKKRFGVSQKEIILDNSETQNSPTIKLEDAIEDTNEGATEDIVENIAEEIVEEIPASIMVKVPFTVQAPFANWDDIHQEACEEASIIMLEYYFSKEKLTLEIAEAEIQALVKFQNKKFGDYKDTTAEQTVDLFLDFYGELPNGKKLKVVYDFDKTDLKKYLARGFPIIIPAAGRELGNPNFTAPGPLYHNLVLTGYNGDTIITNDPGTRKGEGYKYNIDILYNAIHDFPGKPENIKQGRKAMIVVE